MKLYLFIITLFTVNSTLFGYDVIQSDHKKLTIEFVSGSTKIGLPFFASYGAKKRANEIGRSECLRRFDSEVYFVRLGWLDSCRGYGNVLNCWWPAYVTCY